MILYRIAISIILFVAAAFALDPNRAMSQYIRDRWTPENGFFRGAVYAIDQTPDGYLWIATEVGLVRFDGLQFRLIVDKAALPPLTTVVGLGVDDTGDLWVRLPGTTLLRYHNGTFENATDKLGMPFSNVTGLSRASNGALLISRLEGGVLVYSGGKFRTLPFTTPTARSPIISIAQSGNEEIWLGSRDAGLFRCGSGKVSSVSGGLRDSKINALLPDKQNRLWIGTDDGIALWDGSKVGIPGARADAHGFQALVLATDRDNNVWVGTDSRGLVRINPSGYARLPSHTGSPNEAVTALFEDREGNLWVGTANAIERIRDSAFVSYSPSEQLPTNGNLPVFVDPRGRLWFPPAAGGLWWMKDGRTGKVDQDGLSRDVVYSITGDATNVWLGRRRGGLTRLRIDGENVSSTTYTVADGLAQNSVYSVFLAHSGALWAGSLSAGVSKFEDGRFTTFTSADGLASNTVASMIEDADGTIWFATPNGISSFSQGRWRSFGVTDGLPSANVNCLLLDAKSVLWIGTANGIAFRRAGKFEVAVNLPERLREQVLGMEEDGYGWLWISTTHHVVRVRREKLLSGTVGTSDLREYGLEDGLRGLQGVKRHRSVIRDGEGRIWFSMNQGISVVDPKRLESTSPPALVQIQSLSADGSYLPIEHPVQIPPGPKRITLAYAGLGLSVPERIQYRYRLEHFDQHWTEPVRGREAVYTNLGPGKYRFRVIASNYQGIWNSPEASFPFEIEPELWQTSWFRTAMALGTASIIMVLYRLRLRQLTRTLNLRFEERLSERVRIAQELHDTLLQGFISASMQLQVAEDQLPEGSPGKPLLHRVVLLVSQLVNEGRDAVRGLRHSDSKHEDLGQAFSRVEHEIGGVHRAEVRVIVEGRPCPLHPLIRDEIYRIGREALVNALRHSQANKIVVELGYAPQNLRVVVRDDGLGIDPQVVKSGRSGHWGLMGMRERADRIGARIRLTSSANAGTEVELSVPGDIAFQAQSRRGPGKLFPDDGEGRNPRV